MDNETAGSHHSVDIISASDVEWQSPSLMHPRSNGSFIGTPTNVNEPMTSHACLEMEFQELQTKESLKFSVSFLGAQVVYITIYTVIFMVPIACTVIHSFFFVCAIPCHFSKCLRRLPVWIHALSLIVTSILSVIAHPEVQYYLGHRIDFFQQLVELPNCDVSTKGGKCRIYKSYYNTMLLQLTFTYYIMFLLRFRIAIIAIIPCTLIYNVLVLNFSNHEGHYLEFVIFSVSMGIILIAKYTGERSERRLFFKVNSEHVKLVHEKVLRCQAEFKSENFKEVSATSNQITGTIPSDRSDAVTSSASFCFSMVDDGDPIDTLQRIRAVGRKEHWLLDTSSIIVFAKQALGSGGYGVVMKGKLGATPVALKLSKARGQGRKDIKCMLSLANELRVLRRLRHPNIVLFHGAVIEFSTNQLVLVLELVAGDTLQRWILSGSRDSEIEYNRTSKTDYAKKAVLLDISSALSYLHGQRPCIVHGDIKASNIMLEELAVQPRAKLLDFGLSRLLTPRAWNLGGTPSWMAPEVAKGRCQPSSASDVFSFGRVMYFISTEQMPFAGCSKQHLCRFLQLSSPETLLWPSGGNLFFESCRAIGNKCMHAKPELRPQILTVHDSIFGWTLPRNGDRHICKEDSRDSVGLNEFLQQVQGDTFKSPSSRLKRPRTGSSPIAESGRFCALPMVPEDAPVAGHASDVGPSTLAAPRCASADDANCKPIAQQLNPDTGVVDNGPEVDTCVASNRAHVKRTLAANGCPNYDNALDNDGYSKVKRFIPTPLQTKIYTLIDLIDTWQEAPDPFACCPWHNALQGLDEVIARLPGRWKCHSPWGKPPGVYQCPQCLLILEPERGACPVCGSDAGQDDSSGNDVAQAQQGVINHDSSNALKWTL